MTAGSAGRRPSPEPAGDRDALIAEIVAGAARRLGAARVIAVVLAEPEPERPLVVEAGPGGAVVRRDLALPAQALLARVRHTGPELVTDGGRIPPELAIDGPTPLVPLSGGDGLRGALVADGANVGAAALEHLVAVGEAMTIAIEAVLAVEGGRPVSEAGALRAMAATLAGTTQLGRVLAAAARNAVWATGLGRCTVLLRSGDHGLVAAASETAAGPAPLAGWRVFADGLGLPAANAAMATGDPLMFTAPASAADLRPAAWVVPQGVARVLIVPMMAWDEAVGVMVLDDTEAVPVPARDLRIGCGLAHQAAVGVKVARLVDGLQQSRRHARVVLAAMAHAGAQFSTEGVLAVIGDAVHEVIGDSATVVVAANGATAVRGNESEGGELAGRLAAGDGEALVGTDGAHALYGDDLAQLPGLEPGVGRALVVPLRRASQELGWVVSFGPSRRPYRDTDLRIVAALATQGALSLSTVAVLETERTSVNRLEELGRQKTGFVATVSHELRTPLTAIIGFSEILNEWLEEDRLREFVDDVRREAVVLEGIIGNLLDTSRLEAGVLHIDRVEIDLHRLAAESVEVVRHSYPSRDITFDIPGSLPAMTGDPVRVRQILVNLLENAAKYSPERTPVRLHAEPAGENVAVIVEDAGPGIPEQYREQVFHRFFRLEGAHGKPGTGIGLYLVRELTEAHGGSVEIGSGADGVGCRVEVRLPAAA